MLILYRHYRGQQPAELIVGDDERDVVSGEKVGLVVQKIAGVELLKIAELKRLAARVGVIDVVKAALRRLRHDGVDKLVIALHVAQQSKRALILRVLFARLKIPVDRVGIDKLRHRAGEVCRRVAELLAQALLIRGVAERNRRAADDERDERYREGHFRAQ